MTLAVYIGRFQPPHRAHLNTMLAALERHAHLLVLPGSANLARSVKNPWSAPERVRMIRAALAGAGADLRRVRFAPLPDEFDTDLWAAGVRAAVGTREAVLVGFEKDATSSYLRWFPEWAAEASPVTPGLNATDLRRAYFTGEPVPDLPDAVRAALDTFRHTRTFRRLRAEDAAVQAERARLAGAPLPLQEVRHCHVAGGHVWLRRRTGPIGRGLWELPGHRLGPGETPPPGARVFGHPSRSLVLPAVAHVLPSEGGGEAVPLAWALARPRHFFEDHAVIVRRMVQS
ncbi:ADP-ribose pyrophosphatase [uncultured Deinococcus sp.]|uniref:ADP-ribose pyrophosphatase n=1 Tax=uncultured Deinococcus sp. TaxID=158789 RepID=UPI00258806CF|nr:ADP-ribose pyrophosphatase [uncultured Deinococcus sp.]